MNRDEPKSASEEAAEEAATGNVIGQSLPATNPAFWLDLFYGVLFEPAATFRLLADGRYLGRALFIFFVVQMVSWCLQVIIITRGALDAGLAEELPGLLQTGLPQLAAGFSLLFAAAGLAASFIFLFLEAGIFSLLAEILKGKSNARGLLSALALTVLPLLLGVPVRFLGFMKLWPSWIVAAVSLGLWFWTAVLKVVAIRESTGLSTVRAAVVYLIPAGALLLFLAVVLVGGIIVLAPLLSSFIS